MLQTPEVRTKLDLYSAKSGQSALFCAARQGATEVVAELLKWPNIQVNNQVPSHGGTPLHGICARPFTLLT